MAHESYCGQSSSVDWPAVGPQKHPYQDRGVGTDNSPMREYGMDIDLYVSAMQVVPLLLIALFLGNQDAEERRTTPGGRWHRMPDKIYTILSITAFTTSMFVVAGVIDGSRFTMTVVVTALSGSISLLSAQIWRRFNRNQPHTQRPPDQAPVVDRRRPADGEEQAERDVDRR